MKKSALYFADIAQELLTDYKAVLFSPKDPPQKIEPKNGSDFELSELYEAIDCDLVEIISIDPEILGGKYIMIIDEEGKFKSDGVEDLNLIPSAIAFPEGIRNDFIAGKAIICEHKMLK